MGVAPALVILILTLIKVFFTSTTFSDALNSLLEFKRNDLADEARAGCAWLFIAVPLHYNRLGYRRKSSGTGPEQLERNCRTGPATMMSFGK